MAEADWHRCRKQFGYSVCRPEFLSDREESPPSDFPGNAERRPSNASRSCRRTGRLAATAAQEDHNTTSDFAGREVHVSYTQRRRQIREIQREADRAWLDRHLEVSRASRINWRYLVRPTETCGKTLRLRCAPNDLASTIRRRQCVGPHRRVTALLPFKPASRLREPRGWSDSIPSWSKALKFNGSRETPCC